MVDFIGTEYSDSKVLADDKLRTLIIEIGIRNVARKTGVHTDTITLIARGIPVKPITLAKVARSLVIEFAEFDEKR